MTKHKHTPGPWMHQGPDHFRDYNILHQGDALAVAAVVSNMRPSYEIKANAKLIAAAPELLSSLQSLIVHWDGLKPGESLNVDAARAAIAKATV